MGCVRKRGKSWNAQVRMSGWRSFTKIFRTKSDATDWLLVLKKNLGQNQFQKKILKV